ncbi:MAG: right-handed parallel beta-helix repeat-containing protein [Candidatus Heimdallarchaeota archaeon]|nr:right-handed parallel beta-helix repeat-containing protein [Candidatus Heimdallarchaeota archaeon]
MINNLKNHVGDFLNKKWYYLIGGLLCSVIITSIVVPIIIIYLPKDDVLNDDSIESIIILRDEDFENYNFPGSGTKYNPYLIENYNITTSKDYGIYISSTTKYFKIQNCNLEANKTGILINNIAYRTAKIINNVCNNQNYGIFLDSSSGITITSNICKNNSISGIFHDDCADTILINNTCNNNYNGIRLIDSHNAALTNNTCKNNFYGIRLYYSDIAALTNNTISNNGHGISLNDAPNAALTNNTCSNNTAFGILLSDSSYGTLINNNCNNNNNGIRFISSSHVTLINNTCNNNNIKGIKLENSSNAILTNNTCSINNDYGILLSDSFNCRLTNNIFYDCGLIIWHSTKDPYFSHIVENNWVNDKKLGYIVNSSNTIITTSIYGQLILINCSEMKISDQELSNTTVGLTLQYCENSTLTDNTCNNNYYGILLFHSNNASLTNNTCNNNYNGFRLHYSDNIILTNNTITNNTRQGIYSSNCDFGLIIFNYIRANAYYGIYGLGSNNTIHHNSFIDNNLGGSSQAWDSGQNNIWYDNTTSEGNYWSDWIGVGDYQINGGAQIVDPYPLNSPPVTKKFHDKKK